MSKSKKKSNQSLTLLIVFLLALILIMFGIIVGMMMNRDEQKQIDSESVTEVSESEASEEINEVGLAYETAEDAEIDFKVLQSENPDVFAWLYIPGTEIDYPVLQSEESDKFYESHDQYQNESDGGAIYTELANMKSMCDFNTVLNGKGGEDGLFSDLYRYADPEFFESHGPVYLYLDGNLLTYEVFAAFERDNTSLIRTYDFTYISGCQTFLDDLYGSREMGKIIREGWEDVTPYHFLITLTTTSPANPDKQYVVIAALVGDAAGKIDRVVVE